MYSFDRIRDKRGNPAYRPKSYFDAESERLLVSYSLTTMLEEREKVAKEVESYVVKSLEEFGAKMWTGNIMILFDKNKDEATALYGCISWIVRSQKTMPVREEGYDRNWFEYPYYTLSLYFDRTVPTYFRVLFKDDERFIDFIDSENFDEPISEEALKKLLCQVTYDMKQPNIERTFNDIENKRIAEREIKRLK